MTTDLLPRYETAPRWMKQIDRLEWGAGISFFAYGLRIGIRVTAPDILDRVKLRLPHEWEPGCSPVVDQLYSVKVAKRRGASHVVYDGLGELIRTPDLEAALDYLESVSHMYIAQHARNRIFIHAGAVAWQGRAIVVPGQSFAGKSTLVAALMRAGATYYSDEYAVAESPP